MWDLDTIKRINQKAVDNARKGLPERDALFQATGVRDVSKPNLLTGCNCGCVIPVPAKSRSEAA